MNHLSPDFITEMKHKLLEQQALLTKEVAATKDMPDYGRSDEDNATEVADFVAASATNQADQEQLKAVEVALERIAAGTYGVTDEGESIPEARLRANPAATTLTHK